ncbi:hypothetical protein HJG60_001655 [Phyllostomus discolor]|uniref:Uncharacterized protein n=1 Tax=Phyllostomus discolor TaxID=89673 RepID=A0A834EI09_9CHIR|nr:hypothetical protein HJG60_001655 [Phyllostomus discolor]
MVQKSPCYISIVRSATLWERSATLWERSISRANPIPHREITASPCPRFAAHTRNFSESLKLSSLGVPHFPGPAARPSTVIGICTGSHISCAPLRVSRSSSQSQVEETKAAEVGAPANPDSQSALQGAPGNPVGRGAVAMAPETLPKHPHPLGKRGPRADASFPGNLAGAPLSQFAGSPTQLPSKGLIKAWSCPPMRPPQRFQTACSQAPPWPGVNAH